MDNVKNADAVAETDAAIAASEALDDIREDASVMTAAAAAADGVANPANAVDAEGAASPILLNAITILCVDTPMDAVDALN